MAVWQALLLFVIVVLGIYLFTRKGDAGKPAAGGGGRAAPSSRVTASTALLERIWEADRQFEESFKANGYGWRYREATEAQIERIKREGYKVRGALTRGQASDVIGLNVPPDDDVTEVPRFFKMRAMGSETEARYYTRLLLNDEENRAAWEARPASARQKACLQWHGQKIEKGLTFSAAEQHIDALGEDEERFERWEEIENLYDDMTDPDNLEDTELRKPTWPQFLAAVKKVTAGGADLDQSDMEDALVELYPKLRR